MPIEKKNSAKTICIIERFRHILGTITKKLVQIREKQTI